MVAVECLGPDQDIGDRALQSDEVDAPAGQSAVSLHKPPLDDGVGQFTPRRLGHVADVGRKPEPHREGHAGQKRRAPQEAIAARRRLRDLQVGRAGIMSDGGSERPQGRREPNDDGSPRPEGLAHGAHGSPFAALPTLACLVSSSGMTTV